MDINTLLFSFNGRLNRRPFILCIFAVLAVEIVFLASIIAATENNKPGDPVFAFFCLFFGVASAWITLALSTKRIHDRGHSGWFLLLWLVPVLNVWPLVELFFLRGTRGDNRFGADPLDASLVQSSIQTSKASDMAAWIAVICIGLIGFTGYNHYHKIISWSKPDADLAVSKTQDSVNKISQDVLGSASGSDKQSPSLLKPEVAIKTVKPAAVKNSAKETIPDAAESTVAADVQAEAEHKDDIEKPVNKSAPQAGKISIRFTKMMPSDLDENHMPKTCAVTAKIQNGTKYNLNVLTFVVDSWRFNVYDIPEKSSAHDVQMDKIDVSGAPSCAFQAQYLNQHIADVGIVSCMMPGMSVEDCTGLVSITSGLDANAITDIENKLSGAGN